MEHGGCHRRGAVDYTYEGWLDALPRQSSYSSTSMPLTTAATISRMAVSGRLVLMRGPILGLLLRSRPDLWRRALRDFLSDYLTSVSLHDALYFLYLLIRDARLLKLREPDVLHFVPVELDFQPSLFHMDKWRHLTTALGFIQDDTDLEDIKMCSVFLHESLSIPVLTGFHTLMRCFLALNYNHVKGLLSLRPEEADSLKCAIKLTLCTADVENVVRPLWGTELDLFERLGLLQVRCAIDELTYKLEYCDFLLLPEIYTVLLALYDTAVDVVSETSL